MRIVAQDLGVRLGGRVVFSGLSFAWDGPGIVAVTGRNGAGKTTLVKTIAGLLTPGRGTLRWEDGGRALPPAEARVKLGFAGPDVGLYEDLTAVENLAFFARARGLAWDPDAAREWLATLGLGGRGDERLAGYSSGMKQRVKLAFAFQAKPALVLLDEPGSNLDADGRALTARLVHEAAQHALVVVATNEAEEAAWGQVRFDLSDGAAPPVALPAPLAGVAR